MQRKLVGRGLSTLLALTFAWLGSALIDFSVLLGFRDPGPLPVDYYLIYSAFGLAASASFGFLAGAVAGPQVTLAAWAGVNAFHFLGLAGAIVFGLCVLLVLWMTAASRRSPVIFGARIGIACGIALAAWPALSVESPSADWAAAFLESSALLTVATCSIVAFVLIGLTVVDKYGLRHDRAVGEAVIAALLIIASVYAGSQLSQRAGLEKLPERAVAGKHTEAPNVLLIVLDTVRADRMSIFGYQRRTTPRLEAFLSRHDSTYKYPLAFSTASWTQPAHTSLFTGTLPSQHGVNTRTVWTEEGEYAKYSLVSERTLAELFRDAGYQTAAVVANPVLELDPEIRRGFDAWTTLKPSRPLQLLGERIRRTIAPDWLAWAFKYYQSGLAVNRGIGSYLDMCGTGPCFIFANFMDAHGPYIPAPPYAGTFELGKTDYPPDHHPSPRDDRETLNYFSSRYDEQVLSLDARIGDLLDEIESRGFLDTAWLVITSDHGEAFGEHGATLHGTSLYNEQVRVPLIIRPPDGIRLPEVSSAVSLLDVTATLAALISDEGLGIGRSLLDVNPRPPAQMQFFGTAGEHQQNFGGSSTAVRAISEGNWKLIDFGARVEFFDLDTDPYELKNLSGTEISASVLQLRAKMSELPAARNEDDADAERLELSDEETEALRALGYLD